MYPLTICSHNRIVIAPDGWFEGLGYLDFSARSLRINVSVLGPSGFSWLLDSDGGFHELLWLGLEPASFLQTVGLKRRIERYSLAPPRQIVVRELLKLAANLSEAFGEAPNSADLRSLLLQRPADEIVGRELMQKYLGE